jgi:hypothetical protein
LPEEREKWEEGQLKVIDGTGGAVRWKGEPPPPHPPPPRLRSSPSTYHDDDALIFKSMQRWYAQRTATATSARLQHDDEL